MITDYNVTSYITEECYENYYRKAKLTDEYYENMEERKDNCDE